MVNVRSEHDIYLFYKDRIYPQLIELEKERQQIARELYACLIPIGIATLVGTLFLVQIDTDFIKISMPGGLAIGLIIYHRYTEEFIGQFKEKIIRKIIGCIHADFQYLPKMHINKEEFNMSRMFGLESDNCRGDDLVWGKVGDTKIKFSEVHARKGHGRYQKTIFDGLFFKADFNKNFDGTTIILPDSVERLFGPLGTAIQSRETHRGQLIHLEDPEFEEYFVVYGTDQVEGRYILSTSLMRRIVEFRKKTDRDIYLSFNLTSLHLAISCSKDFFEPRIFQSLLSYGDICEYFADAQLAIDIVNDLNLNVRIWSKK